MEAGQRYLLCYKCAEPLFDDDEELEAERAGGRSRIPTADSGAKKPARSTADPTSSGLRHESPDGTGDVVGVI